MKKTLPIKAQKWVVTIARFILAITFTFSGAVKLIDPHGTGYKIEEYAFAYGLAAWLPSFAPIILAIILAILEFSIGVFYLFGIRRWRTTRLALLFMVGMTALTLHTALFHTVADCGCFGDAIYLTPWQTFTKNVILLAAAIITAVWYKRMMGFVTMRNQWSISLYTWAYALIFAGISLWGLPLIDFRPYHIGADLQQIIEEEGKNLPKLVTTFIMEKNGEQREFALENYPDSTWKLVDTRTVQVRKAPKRLSGVQNLGISDEKGQDITHDFLYAPGYKFLLIAPYLEQANDGMTERITALYDYCAENGYPFICLTASGPKAIEQWKDYTGSEYDFGHTDASVLQTMVRANPGLILMQGARIVNKWGTRQLPTAKELNGKVESLELAHPQPKSQLMHMMRIILWYVVPLILFTLTDRIWVTWKLKKLRQHWKTRRTQ